MTGERDAFFELEKSLVRKLIKALGVKLRPKERAGVARIHTADFGAFKRFSGGVAHFDNKRYEEAFASLRAAMKLDADFGLARVTLGQYEQIVARIRAKADTLELSKRELAALAADKIARNDSLVAQRLVEIAQEKGPKNRLRRLAALTFLIGFYNPYGRNHGRISRFQDRFDTMAVRGRVGTLARRYLSEAREVFPAAPMFSSGRHPPDTLDKVDTYVKGLAGALGKGLEHRAENRDRGLIRNLGRVEHFLKLIAADRREAIAIVELALKGMATLDAEPRARQELLGDLAERYLAVGDVAAASGALTRMSAVMTDPSSLKRVATRVEALGAVAKLLAKPDKRAELRELVASRGGRLNQRDLALFVPGPASRRLLTALTNARKPTRWWSHRDPYWYFGAQAAHLIQGEYQIVTGPRKDGLRSDTIHYLRTAKTYAAKDVLIVLGRNPQSKLDVTFEVRRRPAKDFWPINAPREATGFADLKIEPGAAEISLVFGLHGIDTRNVQDPVTRAHSYPDPTRGLALRFMADGAVELVQLGHQGPSKELRGNVMPTKVLTRSAGVVKGDHAKVRLRAVGKKLLVTVNGKKLSMPLPSADAAVGYLGLHFRGIGYGEVTGGG